MFLYKLNTNFSYNCKINKSTFSAEEFNKQKEKFSKQEIIVYTLHNLDNL
jgi:hypothetical protein